jgi:hypothetical protein
MRAASGTSPGRAPPRNMALSTRTRDRSKMPSANAIKVGGDIPARIGNEKFDDFRDWNVLCGCEIHVHQIIV